MNPLERKLIRRLVYAPETMSRNRNFHAFDEPWTRAARRTAALLRSLRTAVHAEHTSVELVAAPAEEAGELPAWDVVISDQKSGIHRRARVSGAELEILCEDARCAQRLGRPVSATD